MSISTTNPATGKTVRTFEPYTAARVNESIDRAVTAYREHRRIPFSERATRMRKAAGILESECREFGKLMTLEMGKPYKAAMAEAEKCATACRYYADNAERFLADEPVRMEGGQAWVAFQPIGVVLAIMPWNFPFWQVFRFAAPALMAGNVGILKHASNVPQCALAIEDIFRRAGFVDGAFQTCSSAPTRWKESLLTGEWLRSRSREAKARGAQSRAQRGRTSRNQSSSSEAAILSS